MHPIYLQQFYKTLKAITLNLFFLHIEVEKIVMQKLALNLYNNRDLLRQGTVLIKKNKNIEIHPNIFPKTHDNNYFRKRWC